MWRVHPWIGGGLALTIRERDRIDFKNAEARNFNPWLDIRSATGHDWPGFARWWRPLVENLPDDRPHRYNETHPAGWPDFA